MPELSDIFRNRFEAFKRPISKKSIIRDREIIQVNRFDDIVPTLESRSDNQALKISQSVNIIPLNKNGTPLYFSSQNFSKRGPLVKLPTYNKFDSIQIKHSPIKARIDANIKYQNSKQRWVGWYWRDPEGIAHIVQPVHVLEGRRIEMFGHLSNEISDKVEVRKAYKAHDTNLITVWTKVPSRSEDKKNDIPIHNLTSLLDPNRHYEWTRFHTEHSCAFKKGGLTFRFRSRYINYCMHDVAAHAAYSRKAAEQSGKIVLQPFPMITEPMQRLYLSLLYDTIKIDATESGRGKSRPLSIYEINPILMDAWLRYGNKKTFWVSTPSKGHKRMSEYNWRNSAAGMPF